jgi:hypothetical protein
MKTITTTAGVRKADSSLDATLSLVELSSQRDRLLGHSVSEAQSCHAPVTRV